MVGLDWGHSNEVRKSDFCFTCTRSPSLWYTACFGISRIGDGLCGGGWLDAYFHIGLKPWDTAAGMLIISEAGGRCSTLEGEPYRVDLPGCLSTNSLIHDELLVLMRRPDALA